MELNREISKNLKLLFFTSILIDFLLDNYYIKMYDNIFTIFCCITLVFLSLIKKNHLENMFQRILEHKKFNVEYVL